MLRVNGFFGHIQRNNLRSVVMFLGFAVACQLIGMAVLMGPLIVFDYTNHPAFSLANYFQKYGLVVFVFSAVLLLVRFFWHVSSVGQTVNFKIVTLLQEPRLHKIIEIQAIGAGISMPKIAVIEDDARNAFACGLGQKSAVVVVTRGLLQALDDEELEAVVAHEITHIVNGDIQLMALANVMVTTLLLFKKYNPFQVSYLKYFMLAVLVLTALAIVFSGGMITIYVMMAGPLLFSIVYIFVFLSLASGFVTSLGMTVAKLSRLLIASSREFIADAEAARMTKNPAALISALRRIDGRSQIDGLDETIDAMMIDGAVEGAFASHPTIADRIATLAQHAGAMVHGAGIRKDTRNYGKFAAGANGKFGQRVENSKEKSNKPKRLLIDRVNAGSGENAFGLSPMVRNFVLLGVLGVVVLSYIQSNDTKSAAEAMGGFSKKLEGSRPDPKYVRGNISSAIPARFAHVSSKIPASVIAKAKAERKAKAKAARARPQTKAQKNATRLASLDPLKARCFGHDDRRYYVGRKTPRSFKKPDLKKVQQIIDGKRGLRVGLDIESYAVLRINSQKRVAKASSKNSLDKALKSYVNTRKSMLMTMHRYYGHKGLIWMRDAYEDSQNRKIIRQLKKRILRGKKTRKNSELYNNVALLVDNSKHFVPCYARALWNLPRKSKKRKTAGFHKKRNAKPKLPVLNTSIRGTN